MKKILLSILVSFLALQLTMGQSSDEQSREKGQLVPVPAYYGAFGENQNQKSKLAPFSAIYTEDFEGNTDDWTSEGAWNIGQPISGPQGSFSSRNSAGTRLSGPYPASANDTLMSPAISLTAGSSEDIYLEFYEWFELESNHDYGFVIISTDGGENWTTLHERSGQSDWVLNHISLNNYKNEEVHIGFVITSDDSFEFEGWFIDDVSIITRPANELETSITSLNTQEFPFVFMNVDVDTFGVGHSGLTSENFTVTENGRIQENYFQVVPPQQSGQVRLTDIVFIMDNSGSMSEEQQAVSDNVFNFVDSLEASGVDYRLGLTRYGSGENSGLPIFTNSANLTPDAEEFKNDIWTENNISGSFEPGYRSLVESVSEFSFRPGAQKIFIIITDETPDQDQITLTQVQQALNANSITLFALTITGLESTFEPLVDDEENQIFNIYDPFDEILDFIGDAVSNTYVVRYRTEQAKRDGIRRHVQVEVNYDGRQALDNASYLPGSAPDLRRTQNTILYGTQGWAKGTAFEISVRVRDEVEPFPTSATLFYRTTGGTTYNQIVMEESGRDQYSATIPAGFADEPGIDYYITTTDGQSSASVPRVNPNQDPYQIPILPNEPPLIVHEPVINSEAGQAITIQATITDNTNDLESAVLFYREFGQLSFTRDTMEYQGNNVFEQVIPSHFVVAEGVEYFIEAKDDLGIKSLAPGNSDNPAFISTGEVIEIDLTSVSNGPRAARISVPENGTGYIYYEIQSDETIYFDDFFTIELRNVDTDEVHEVVAQFLRDNVIQLQIPNRIMGPGGSTTFQFEPEFNIDNASYELDSGSGVFTAISVSPSFSRTWSIYASGSAGVSKTIGFGAGTATIAAAKASISGTGGVGLSIHTNQNEELSVSRRMHLGVATSVSVPKVDAPLVDEIVPTTEASLLAKVMAGQTVDFSTISDPNTRSMAQSGYLLETISLGGAAVSPSVGLMISAVVRTINASANINRDIEQAVSQRFGGIGLEGEISTASNYNLRGVNVKLSELSGGFALNGFYYQYPLGLPENNSVTSGLKITSALGFNMSERTWNVQNMGLLNFATGLGSEASIAGYWQANSSLSHLTFSLTNGADIDVSLLESDDIGNLNAVLKSYQTTEVEVPGAYVEALIDQNSIFSGIAEPSNADIELTGSVAENLENDFNQLTTNVLSQNPLKVRTKGKRGVGIDYSFKKSFEASLGVGGGVDIGLDLKYLDEVTFPQSQMDIYAERENYLIYEAEYDENMHRQEIEDVLTELFEGTIPLISEAWNNLVAKVQETIEAGTEFIIDVATETGEAFASIKGTITQAGEFLTARYSPNSDRVRQKGFNIPEVQDMYSSSNVFYPTKNKASGQQLQQAGSELIVISDVLNLAFIPEGSTTPITTLPSAVELSMNIEEEDLTALDFTLADTSKVKIYRYDLSNNGWILVGGSLDGMSLNAQITELGEYALGIEINRDNDNKKPEIYNYGYIAPDEESENANQVFANIRDDRYGSGIDFSKTYMFLNDDTLSYTFQPAEGRMFYRISESDNLTGDVEIMRVEVTDYNGNKTVQSYTFEAGTTTTVGTENKDEVPNQFELLNNYPNPFNPQTNIQFKLPEASHVQINIYDVLGRYVETLINERVEAGTHTVTWEATSANGQHLSTGIYFYQIKAGDFNQVKKMMFVK